MIENTHSYWKVELPGAAYTIYECTKCGQKSSTKKSGDCKPTPFSKVSLARTQRLIGQASQSVLKQQPPSKG